MRDSGVSSDEIREMLAEVATLQVAVKRGVLMCHLRDALANAEARDKEAT